MADLFSFFIENNLAAMDALQDANRAALRLMSGQGAGFSALEAKMGEVLIPIIDTAQDNSPYLTGTLSLSHRGEVFTEGASVVGFVYLDESVENPLNFQSPAIYGPIVHKSQPWLDWTVDATREGTIETLGEAVFRQIEAIYQSGFAN